MTGSHTRVQPYHGSHPRDGPRRREWVLLNVASTWLVAINQLGCQLSHTVRLGCPFQCWQPSLR